jgi:deoxycytidylate deaminase
MEPKNEFKDPSLYAFVPETHPVMQSAKEAASVHSLTPNYPIGIVAAIEGKVICAAGNGNGYHEASHNKEGHINGCRRMFISQERVKNGGEKIKPGQEFDLCPGCHTDFHAEANLTRKAAELNIDLKGADVHMYGHYWCCGECWEKMKKAGVGRVILPDTYKKFEDLEEVKKWAKECAESKINK